MKIDGNIDEGGKSALGSEDFEHLLSDAIELVIDGIRREVSQVVQQRFSERIPSSRRYIHLLITVKLERFAARVCELVIEGNTREDFDKILSRVLSARFHTEF